MGENTAPKRGGRSQSDLSCGGYTSLTPLKGRSFLFDAAAAWRLPLSAHPGLYQPAAFPQTRLAFYIQGASGFL